MDRVVLPVSVLDRKGHPVAGLSAPDFRVFEDGRPQRIVQFYGLDTPVTIGLLIDASGSMGTKRAAAVLAALHLVRLSNPEDQVFVVNFNDKITFGLPPGTLFSSDPDQLRAALSRGRPAGRTALYDAISAGLGHLTSASRDRKALVALSDGGDNASRAKIEDVLEMARKSDAIIYTIGLIDEANEDRNPRALRKLARLTGGQAFLPDSIQEIRGVCERIASDLRAQYTIIYAPDNGRHDGSYRRVRVLASCAGRSRLSARTRPGYYAPSENLADAAGGNP